MGIEVWDAWAEVSRDKQRRIEAAEARAEAAEAWNARAAALLRDNLPWMEFALEDGEDLDRYKFAALWRDMSALLAEWDEKERDGG